MDKNILIEILKSKNDDISVKEIEDSLNEELSKSPEEMDTDLVDLCLKALKDKGL